MSRFEWYDDCQGKKDYDGAIMQVFTRFWPGGYQKNGLCSAKSDISVGGRELFMQEFEGTESEVKADVEGWVEDRIDQIEHRLDDMDA